LIWIKREARAGFYLFDLHVFCPQKRHGGCPLREANCVESAPCVLDEVLFPGFKGLAVAVEILDRLPYSEPAAIVCNFLLRGVKRGDGGIDAAIQRPVAKTLIGVRGESIIRSS